MLQIAMMSLYILAEALGIISIQPAFCRNTYLEESVETFDVAAQLREVRNKTKAFLIGKQVHQTAGVNS